MYSRASLWCAHPRLRNGEAFSSWLHRSALANGLSDHTYCRYVFGERAVWNRDVDHVADDAMLESASKATGEVARRLHEGTLRKYEGVLHEYLGEAQTPWVLPLGVYHRVRKSYGQQFCPKCLRQDEPWLRLHWRLAWVTCCVEHGSILRDACPKCDSPLIFHRAALDQAGHLRCHSCGADVSSGSADTLVATDEILRLQAWLETSLTERSAKVGARNISNRELFRGLRVLVRGTFDNAHLRGMQSAFDVKEMNRPRFGIERWRLSQRVFAMQVLAVVLNEWPVGFRRLCRTNRVLRSRFESQPEVAYRTPRWVRTALEGIMYYPPSKLLTASAIRSARRSIRLSIAELSLG